MLCFGAARGRTCAVVGSKLVAPGKAEKGFCSSVTGCVTTYNIECLNLLMVGAWDSREKSEAKGVALNYREKSSMFRAGKAVTFALPSRKPLDWNL